jgi:hypothetical protein
MSDFNHRVGVSEDNLVIRTLKLTKITGQNKNNILAKIDEAFGIDAVSFDDEKHELHLAYDATHINLDGIEEIIRSFEADVADSWWNHIKEDYYKFVDQNVKDNANHKPWSCHKSPPGVQKK